MKRKLNLIFLDYNRKNVDYWFRDDYGLIDDEMFVADINNNPLKRDIRLMSSELCEIIHKKFVR